MLAFALIYFQNWLILKSCKLPGWVNEEWQGGSLAEATGTIRQSLLSS